VRIFSDEEMAENRKLLIICQVMLEYIRRIFQYGTCAGMGDCRPQSVCPQESNLEGYYLITYNPAFCKTVGDLCDAGVYSYYETDVIDNDPNFVMMGNITVNEGSGLRLGNSLDFPFIIQVVNSVPE
jgi:hypothetical protein